MRPVLTADVVRGVVSGWTGIPVRRMIGSEGADGSLKVLEEKLSSAIFGQGEAIAAVTEALKRRFVLKQEGNTSRPMASLMFVGPSGTGKTELVRQIAVHFFGHAKKLIKINMNDFREPHTASRLVGAPPGYVGYDRGGELTEAIRKEPFSTVLFDEVEKAHPQVVTNVLLQMIGEGVLTDMSTGATVDCSDTMVIMTGNLGNRHASERNIGFGNGESSGHEKQYRDKVLDAVRDFFPPELIGRLDNIIVFNHLTESAREGIFDREVRKLEGRLFPVSIRIAESARGILLDEAKDDQAGARAVQRVFRKRIEEPCAGLRMSGRLKEGAPAEIAIHVDAEGRLIYEVQAMTDGEEGKFECKADTKGI